MKHVFIVNPAAGKSDRTDSCRKLIDAAFSPRGLQYELLVSQAPGDCRKLAQQAAASGEEVRLYACGGDGTLNEVINGVVGCPNAAVTHYPGGSGNDAIKIFDDPAAFTSIERLLSAEEAPFDLIRCNDSYALNVLSIGFDADGTITGVGIRETSDTPGLGLKAKDDDYRNQYVGKNCESLSVTKSGSASDTEINAISGATITSNATTNAVNAALYYLHNCLN